jgi:hypothetical protein
MNFIIFTINKGKKASKTDKNNNYLFNCLIELISEK